MTQPNSTRIRKLTDLGAAVDRKVSELQRRFHAETRDSAVAGQLARLRRAVAEPAGSVPEVWADTIALAGEGERAGDTPTTAERAAHCAVTLYALHQQGLSGPAHRAGVSLGAAARTLAYKTERADAIRSRFQAIALADTDAGIEHHLRALITLLRSEGIALDYGRLADDLRTLFGRKYAQSVRLRWGRDFSRRLPADADDGSTSATESKQSTSQSTSSPTES